MLQAGMVVLGGELERADAGEKFQKKGGVVMAQI